MTKIKFLRTVNKFEIFTLDTVLAEIKNNLKFKIPLSISNLFCYNGNV